MGKNRGSACEPIGAKKRLIVRMICVLLMLAGVLCCFGGCAFGIGSAQSYFLKNCIQEQKNDTVSARYELFRGNRVYTIHVPEGKELAVRVEITTESGTLGLTIQKDGQDTVYEGNHLETGTFTVYLRESGTYRVNFLANEHKGSYRVSWGPVTEESL